MSEKIPATGFWTFICNPAKWDVLCKFANTPTQGQYVISDDHIDMIQPGDLGVIRVGIDRRNQAKRRGAPKLRPGIYAIVQTTGHPRLRTAEDNNDSCWYEKPPEPGKRHVVDIRYLHILTEPPLFLDDLKQHAGITDKYILNSYQGATRPLDASTFSTIIELAAVDLLRSADLPLADTHEHLNVLEALLCTATPKVREQISRRIERGIIAGQVKKATGYKCLICESVGQPSHSFKTKNGLWFVEAHHVDPVSRLTSGSLGPSNIITVCPNHHRQIHYGNVEVKASTPAKFVFCIDGSDIEIPRVILARQKS